MKIKLIDFNGPAPVRAHDNDAGADVFSPRDQPIYPGQVYKLPLGFGLELPDGYVGYIFPRSSLSARGIVCELPPIDSGYRGEVHAIVSNVGGDGYDIKKGDRIGQLVIMPGVIPEFTYATGTSTGPASPFTLSRTRLSVRRGGQCEVLPFTLHASMKPLTPRRVISATA